MASKAKNHFKALASSSSVPELAASSMRDSTYRLVRARIQRCKRAARRRASRWD
jgi:hypothetical protein